MDTSLKMKETHPNWKALPVEILLKIFQMAVEGADEGKAFTCQLVLVCKSWMTPARSVLYSNVTISSLIDLKQFHNTLKINPQLGKMIKEFYLDADEVNDMEDEVDREVSKDEVFDLMTNILDNCLPNLEKYNECGLNSYVPLLNALQDSKLQRLKRLSSPSSCGKSELSNYATCALLIRDRIEKIVIEERRDLDENERETHIRHLYFNRLYNKLRQFDQLSKLIISMKTTDEIQVFETILERCKPLKKLIITLYQSVGRTSSPPPDHNKFINAAPSYTPSHNIKSLNATLSGDHKVITYIMKTFPNLREFTFRMNRNTTKFDQHILTQLLNYSSGIDKFSAGDIRVDGHDISETIGDYWASTPKPRKESVQLFLIPYISEEQSYLFSMSNDSNGRVTTLNFPFSQTNLLYTDFIEKNGLYIDDLQFSFILHGYRSKGDLPRNFFPHTFNHCPNLRTLKLSDCAMKPSIQSRIDLRKTLSLEELYLYRCTFYPGSFERLSLMIPKIEHLRIGSFVDNNRGDQLSESATDDDEEELEVLMPQTQIDCVSIVFFHEVLYVKVFALDWGEYYYYKNHQGEEKLKVSNEQEYAEKNDADDTHIYICCKGNPEIKIG